VRMRFNIFRANALRGITQNIATVGIELRLETETPEKHKCPKS